MPPASTGRGYVPQEVFRFCISRKDANISEDSVGTGMDQQLSGSADGICPSSSPRLQDSSHREMCRLVTTFAYVCRVSS